MQDIELEISKQTILLQLNMNLKFLLFKPTDNAKYNLAALVVKSVISWHTRQTKEGRCTPCYYCIRDDDDDDESVTLTSLLCERDSVNRWNTRLSDDEDDGIARAVQQGAVARS